MIRTAKVRLIAVNKAIQRLIDCPEHRFVLCVFALFGGKQLRDALTVLQVVMMIYECVVTPERRLALDRTSRLAVVLIVEPKHRHLIDVFALDMQSNADVPIRRPKVIRGEKQLLSDQIDLTRLVR
jgi:hypothetical protein